MESKLSKAFLIVVIILSAVGLGSTWVGNTAHNQAWSAQVTLLAADTTKTLKAAPGAGASLVVTDLACTSLTSHAATTDIEDTSGTVEAMRIATTATVNQRHVTSLSQGLPLTANEALIIKPSAAGPSLHCVAEGYILR